MNIVNSKDFLEVKLVSLIADYDVETIANLYQPIVGHQAISLYITLWSEAKNQKISPVITHEQLFNRMQISPSEFVEARKSLEAVGLIETFLEKNKDLSFYRYSLFAPKTPKIFFDNVLLYGMLIRNIGEVDANRYKSLYYLEQQTSVGKNISASFAEVFHPDLDNPVFAKVLLSPSSSVDRVGGRVQIIFSYEAFFNSLGEISQIKPEAITKKEMKEIERISTLYGVDEIAAANYVVSVYSPDSSKGNRIDFEQLTKFFQEETNYNYLAIKRNKGRPSLITSESDLANKVKLMEIKSPKDYLGVLQHATRPALSDLKLINDLSANFNLPNGVINAIIDFVLAVNNNVFSRAYSEKIAASIAREGLTTAADTMNFLRKIYSPKSKKLKMISKQSFDHSDTDNLDAEDTKKTKTDNLPTWEEIFKAINGGSDGKA